MRRSSFAAKNRWHELRWNLGQRSDEGREKREEREEREETTRKQRASPPGRSKGEEPLQERVRITVFSSVAVAYRRGEPPEREPQERERERERVEDSGSALSLVLLRWWWLVPPTTQQEKQGDHQRELEGTIGNAGENLKSWGPDSSATVRMAAIYLPQKKEVQRRSRKERNSICARDMMNEARTGNT